MVGFQTLHDIAFRKLTYFEAIDSMVAIYLELVADYLSLKTKSFYD